MYQNQFETLAVETTLSLRQAAANQKWAEIGCFFIKNYLGQLSKEEQAVIGHIKGLIELAEGGFIKLSSVSLDKPVNCDDNGSAGASRDGHLTFNAIVSGVSKERNIQFFQMALARTCSVYEMMTDYREPQQAAGQPHHEDPVCPSCHGHHHPADDCAHHH
jgi:hypothetical protein